MNCFSPVSLISPGIPEPVEASIFKVSGPIQLHDKIRGRAEVEQAMIGQTKVGRVRSTGHDISVVVEDQITVLMPINGTVVCEVQNETFQASTNEALVLSPNPRQTRVKGSPTENFEAIPLLFSMSDIQEQTEELGGSVLTRKRLENFGLALSFGNSLQGQQFSRLVGLLVDELASGARPLSKKGAQSWSHLLSEKLVTLLDTNSVIELPNTEGKSTAYRHVLRAEDYMHGHFADITTAADIAKQCGISVRSLEMAFKAARSQSPMACLANIRLDHAQHMLGAPSGAESVTQVAMECGFNHLGRFAIAYRRQYGESPSETMRKR